MDLARNLATVATTMFLVVLSPGSPHHGRRVKKIGLARQFDARARSIRMLMPRSGEPAPRTDPWPESEWGRREP